MQMRYYTNQFIAISTNNNKDDQYEIVLNHKLLPYIVYWCILWMICVVYAHVQISTRFICCSCPALYWFCAQIICNDRDREKDREKNEATSKHHLLDNLIDMISQTQLQN
eukprot:TRINITY_DN12058_c0_g1_i1.p1 TRINITY_DN12058_c0_g1~~TRINITY_DN12058_c0_g1_i1.p1  ORF type:complete len:110 (-),score=16.91 TRINITY_DN12058_c0_g1_i1:128-457(-)